MRRISGFILATALAVLPLSAFAQQSAPQSVGANPALPVGTASPAAPVDATPAASVPEAAQKAAPRAVTTKTKPMQHAVRRRVTKTASHSGRTLRHPRRVKRHKAAHTHRKLVHHKMIRHAQRHHKVGTTVPARQ